MAVQIAASKLNTYGVLDQVDVRGSKLNTYAALDQIDERVSKLVTYLLLDVAPVPPPLYLQTRRRAFFQKPGFAGRAQKFGSGGDQPASGGVFPIHSSLSVRYREFFQPARFSGRSARHSAPAATVVAVGFTYVDPGRLSRQRQEFFQPQGFGGRVRRSMGIASASVSGSSRAVIIMMA
jgi:hypothetical protein